MTPRRIDLTGRTCGDLVVLGPNAGGGWACLCKCGNYTVQNAADLEHGKVRSCGCYRKTRHHKHFWNGEANSVRGWAEKIGMKPSVLRARLNRGWPIEKALTEPVKLKRSK